MTRRLPILLVALGAAVMPASAQSLNVTVNGVSVASGGSVPLAVGAAGQTSTAIVLVTNTGNATMTISSLSLTGGAGMTLNSPSLPVSLAANGSGSVFFTIQYIPVGANVTGMVSIGIDNQSGFTFSVTETVASPALPSYQFQGAPANPQPAQQPSIGLTLSSPYALPLQGTLTLTFAPAANADDSSIQFASGGRTAPFTIPANTTQALFNNGATTVPLQTGTTAGNIVITPSFALQNGFDLTPSPPQALTLTIQPAAPQLLNATLSNVTSNSFTVTLTGYTTSRVLNNFNIQLSAQQGQSFSPSQVTIDVSSTSAAWFQSTISANYGGSFLVQIPFAFSGSGSQVPVQLLQSLSITAVNNVGTSTALSVPVQ